MHLSQYLDLKQLNDRISQGYVDVRYHKEFPLVLYCYSRAATYDNVWDDITTKCRGLIVHAETMEIVARPFEKFFNWNTTDRPETWPENLPTHLPMVLEKLDGSLGIVYTYEGKDYVASKGSFHSDHADWATKEYQKTCVNPQWPEGYTPVLEMICQDVQHHIVHYEQDGLYLIGLVNKETGDELGYNSLYHYAYLNGLKVPKIYGKTLDQCLADDTSNEEGYVATWFTGQVGTPKRVKIKFREFLVLQKLMHNTKAEDVVDLIVANTDFDEMFGKTPLIFQTWVRDVRTEAKNQYYRIYNSCANFVKHIKAELVRNVGTPTRKDYALAFTANVGKDFAYKPVFFAMLDMDNEKINKVIWKLVKERLGDQKAPLEVGD